MVEESVKENKEMVVTHQSKWRKRKSCEIPQQVMPASEKIIVRLE